MDHGQDFFSRDPEKIVCLEKLDALVDHRGAVDADLSPHGPDGMRRRLLGRNRVELFQRRAQERAARSRQNQPFHMIVIFAGKTLPERVVLAVERTDLTAAHGGGQALAHDQRRFLVGQADFLAQFHRARQRLYRGDAGRGENDMFHFVGLDQTKQRFLAFPERHILGQIIARLLQHDNPRRKLPTKRRQRFSSRLRGQRRHLKELGIGTAHVKRRRAHAAGAADHGHLFFRVFRHSSTLRAGKPTRSSTRTAC